MLTAWDEQTAAKVTPGDFNVQYVAGMNVTNLPTNCFSVSNSFSEADVYLSNRQYPLGVKKYVLMMFCPSMTAFRGDGKNGRISESDKLGGLVIRQIDETDLDDPWIRRSTFQEVLSARTMLETYGSDMTKFSAGGFIWASQMTCNILTPAANLVGSYYRGTIQFG